MKHVIFILYIIILVTKLVKVNGFEQLPTEINFRGDCRLWDSLYNADRWNRWYI